MCISEIKPYNPIMCCFNFSAKQVEKETGTSTLLARAQIRMDFLLFIAQEYICHVIEVTREIKAT